MVLRPAVPLGPHSKSRGEHGASHVVLAVPVAAPDSLEQLAEFADEVVCLQAPRGFFAVGQWYQNFTQISDEEVTTLLSPAAAVHVATVDIPVGGIVLRGDLTVPGRASGTIVFAHGSGSSRFSRRNRWVAHALNERGFATLLFDLLLPTESEDRANVFDVELLGGRLGDAAAWLRGPDGPTDLAELPIGYFGASTGAAAALWAAAVPGRGSRPSCRAAAGRISPALVSEPCARRPS